MRELQVLGDGHLKLDFADWKEFFESEMTELVRGQVKMLLEQALLAERDRYLDLGYYEHDPQFRWDYRNGYYFRDFTTRLGRLQNLRIPRLQSPAQKIRRHGRRHLARPARLERRRQPRLPGASPGPQAALFVRG